MTQGTAKLVVDLGNSETRVGVIYGKGRDGLPKRKITTMSNRYVDIVRDFNVSPDYNEGNSRIFKFNEGSFCTGELCDKEFGTYSYRPTALEKKYDSDISRMSIINAFLQGYISIGLMTNNPATSVDVDWDVTVLLPPADINTGGKQMAELVKAITEIDFKIPKIKKQITINKVNVLPEGFCAFIGAVYEKGKRIRDGYKHLLSETTILFDIGAGTSDICIVEDGRVVNSSRFTVEFGGNNVHQKVKELLKEERVVLPDNVVREGTEKGWVKDGSKKVDIRKLIYIAKDEVSKSIISAVRDFFESSQFPVKTIENIIVVGGGAMDSDVQGITSLAVYISQYMKRLSENINFLELPYEDEEENKKVSPRMLNILGACVLSE